MPVFPQQRISWIAAASLLLGLLLVPGPLAMFLGWIALRAINTSDGQLRGARLAIAGMTLGGLGSILLVLGAAALTILALRAQSDRAECQNNLRLIGLAVAQFHEQNGSTFPRAVLPLAGQPPEKRLSWLAAVLPYLDERPNHTFSGDALAARLDRAQPWDAPENREAVTATVPRYLCRAHPAFVPRSIPALTHYVGLTGIDPKAADLPKEDPRAGLFGYERIIGIDDITAGTSFTLLAAETTRDNGPWAAGGTATARGLDPAESHYIGWGRPFGGCHRAGESDVLEALYADGAVRFITATVAPEIFRASARISRDVDRN